MAGKKITELSSGSLSNISLSGVTTVVYSGTTFQHSLSDLRNKLVDSGSHYFTGSQHIIGDLTVSGSITSHEYILSSSITNIEIQNVSGSSNFGNDLEDTHIFTGSVVVTGSVDVSGSQRITDNLIIGLDIHHNSGDPEVLHAANSGSYNIAHFQGDNEYYTQINVVNLNSSSLSSTDIVATADNGNETVHFVNLGINSSTYNGGYVGYENDAYLLNVGKDLYIGTVGGTSHPAELKLFAQNSWENPQITIHTGSEVSFNTGSVTEGYVYEFSGSVKLNNDLTVNGNQIITGSIYLENDGGINFGTNNTYIGMGEGALFLRDSTGYIQLDAQNNTNYAQIILNADNEDFFYVNHNTTNNNLKFTTNGSLLINEVSYDAHLATTGSNTFVGNQTISGSLIIVPQTEEDNVDFGGATLLNVGNVESQNSVTVGNHQWDVNQGISSTVNANNSLGIDLTINSAYDSNTDTNGNVIISTGPTSNWNFGNDGIITLPGDGVTIDTSGVIDSGQLNIVLPGLNSAEPQVFRFSDEGGGGELVFPDGTRQSTAFTGQINTGSFATTGSNTFIGDQNINGTLTLNGVSENITVDGGFSGDRTFDFTSGSIFYITGLTGNGVWNVQNVPTTDNKSITITYVIEQGSTAYSGSGYQINGSDVTIKWSDSEVPTGSVNNTEIIGLTAFRVGSSWNVIGSLTTFGV